MFIAAYSERSPLEVVAMKAAMVMPALLQKPHSRAKLKNMHALHLEYRFNTTMGKCKAKELNSKSKSSNETTARTTAHDGKVDPTRSTLTISQLPTTTFDEINC